MTPRAPVLLLLVAAVGCGERTEYVPGTVRALDLRLAFADLPEWRRAAIDHYELALTIGPDRFAYRFAYDEAARVIVWLDEPGAELPVEGRLRARISARSADDTDLRVGGDGGPLELSLLPRGGNELPVIVTARDAFTPLAVRLAYARHHHQAAVVDTRLLIVGGVDAPSPSPPFAARSFVAASELVDVFSGEVCASDDEACFAWGEAPSARIEHAVVTLEEAFASRCAWRDALFVGLGRGPDGQALGDAYLFSAEAGFRRLEGAALTPRIGAVVFATKDCRLVIAGGADAGGKSLGSYEVIRIGAQRRIALLEHGDAAALATRGAGLLAAPEVGLAVLVGGSGSSGEALDGSVALWSGTTPLAVCGPGVVDAACGPLTGARMECARARPSSVTLSTDAEGRGLLAAALVFGAPDERCLAGSGAELVRVSSSRAVTHLPLSRQPIVARGDGVALAALGDDVALVIGGLDAAKATPTATVERVRLGDAFTGSSSSAPVSFTVVGDGLDSGLAFAAVAVMRYVLFVSGGFDAATSAASGRLEVFGHD